MRSKRVKTTKIKELIIPAKGYAILRTSISKGKNEYVFYDIQYGNVIITGCRVIEGKKGDFLAMPSREGSDGEYYPVVYLSHDLSSMFMEWIEDADENEDWEEVEDDFYLRHVEDDKPKKKSKKAKTVVEDDEEEDDEEEDEEEEEKPKKKAKTKTQQNKKKAAADDAEDYPF